MRERKEKEENNKSDKCRYEIVRWHENSDHGTEMKASKQKNAQRVSVELIQLKAANNWWQ